MDIVFDSKDLEELCTYEKAQLKRLGAACAKKLKRRLADLRAAARVSDLVAGRPHPLKGDRSGQFAVDLHGGFRLVFKPTIDPPVQREDGSIAWELVTSVRIIYIGNYHE